MWNCWKNYEISIGINLGNSYSSVGVWTNGKLQPIPNDYGELQTPSVVSFYGSYVLVGQAAKNRMLTNAENTVFDIKRLIGKRFDDAAIQNDIKYWPFKVVSTSNRPSIKVKNKNETKLFSSEELLAMILFYLKQAAQQYIGKLVKNTVISVPACFNNSQRQSTINAAAIAGLHVLQIINEPTAVALAYGQINHQINPDQESDIIIFDLGSGTLDVSLVSIDDGVYEVKAVSGNTHFGGMDFDNILMEHFITEFGTKTEMDCTQCTASMIRLKMQCQRAKCILSASEIAYIKIDAFYDGIDFYSSITRKRFETLCINRYKQCLKYIDNVLSDSNMSRRDIDAVVLVGCSTKIPKIQEMITGYFEGKQLNVSLDSAESVVHGASLQAAILSGCDLGDAEDSLILDVTPLSLGIRTKPNGITAPGIQRNKTIPCKSIEMFFENEYKNGLEIEIHEGDRQFAKDNNLLGTFVITDTYSSSHVPTVEVNFDLNANGILSVYCRDKKNPTGYSHMKVISIYDDHLSRDELNQYINQAQQWRFDDVRDITFLIIHGFIRQTQSNLRIEQTIPEVIGDICFAYFREYFLVV